MNFHSLSMWKTLEKMLDRAEGIADRVSINSTIKRRPFLAAMLGAETLLTAQAAEAEGKKKEESRYDILYAQGDDIEAILDYQEDVARVLRADVAKKLKVLGTQEGDYVLIYDRNGTKDEAVKTAAKHTKLLRKRDLEKAQAVDDRLYHELWNISYGKSSDLEGLKKDYATVYSQLGPTVGKNLVIEKINGDYAIVWRRRGERESTEQIAARHRYLVEKLGAKAIEENNNAVVWSESDYLHKKAKPKPKPKTPPEKREPDKVKSLEGVVEKFIGECRLNGKISGSEETSFLVYDLRTGEKLVSINEDKPRQCASMVKPFVALAYFHLVGEGKKTYNASVKKKMERMIQKSSNSATNDLIDAVGGPLAVQAILKKHYSGIFQQTEIVEKIPGAGQTYKNKASAHDYSRFLHALWNDTLPSSNEMKRLMALPGRDRLYTGAKKVPAGTLVYNKTGTTGRLVGDMGILVAKGENEEDYPYIIVGIVEKATKAANYTAWKNSRGNVIRDVSSTVYEHLKGKHKLI